jgi:hypothetical protein
MKDRYPGLPLIVAGFSFGSSMGLKVSCSDPDVERAIAIGLPVDRAGFGFVSHCACPKFFIHSTNDEYGSRDRMQEVFDSAPEPKHLRWVEAEDHFFANALDDLEAAAREAVEAPLG